MKGFAGTLKAQDFQPMLSCILPSDKTEVTLGKQPVFSPYGQEVRSALNALPSEITQQLLSEYRTPQPPLIHKLASAIQQREQTMDHAAQGQSLDQAWLQGSGGAARPNQTQLSAEDEWNARPPGP